MIRKFFSIFRLSTIFAIVSMILITFIHYVVQGPFELLFQLFSILVVFFLYRAYSAMKLGNIIKGMPLDIEKLLYDRESLSDTDLYTGPFYNDQKMMTAIFDNFNNLYSRQQSLLNEVNTLYSELKQTNETKDLLIDINHTILDFDNQVDFLNNILKKTVDTLPLSTHGCVLKFIDDYTTEYIAAYGYSLSDLKTVHLTLDETFLYVATEGKMDKPIIVGDIRNFNKEYIQTSKYNSFNEMHAYDVNTCVSSPILIDNKLYGMLNIDSEKPNAFGDDILPIMTYISGQISIALKNYITYKKTVRLSKYDRLTGIFNRSYFEEIFENYYKKALRYQEHFVIAMLDMNDLKVINDTLGHDAGDYALKELVNQINLDIRESDIFARYGGDEFIIVFFNATEKEVQLKLITLQIKIEQKVFLYNKNPIKLSFSYGTSYFPNDNKTIDDLIKIADTNMYLNKTIQKK